MRLYDISAHHLQRILHEYDHLGELERNLRNDGSYDKATIENVISFIKRIIKKPGNAKIRIVEGKDYICDMCNQKDNCENVDYSKYEDEKYKDWIIGDRGWLKFHGWKLGGIFYAKDLSLFDKLTSVYWIWKISEKKEHHDEMKILEEKIYIQKS